MFRSATLGALPWLFLAVSRLTSAACECGYSLNKTSDADHAVFTELLENDFLHTSAPALQMKEYGWQPQVYEVNSKSARGPYGKNFQLNNIVTNPLKSSGWSGDAEHGGDAGLELWVRANHIDGLVSGSEIVSARTDALLGSFRVGMKLSNSSGTCGAFFFYHNNSQEIDMEFLSHQFNESQGAVNLVLQSPQSLAQGYDAANTSGFEFHEYRFDWTKERVSFYVDGVFLYEMTENVPTEGGGIFLQPLEQRRPNMSYFNSTDTERSQNAYKKRCPTYDPAKVCAIPSQDTAPDVSVSKDGAKTYFFSHQKDMTPGQTSYVGAANSFGVSSLSIAIPVLVTALSWSLAW
ncbi:hypothetical protein SNOG_10314 [Parastagonospora nodorum SN15]|uniref:GH16 domain-containing protein n=1 Tax=Phaeosphaeria nodorum (strain SN15 / ATCC MYA-4574 / FGSC 10173) TaxID=321614 RepID=Q0UD50_PHANO|nr:hypothetical protein SNOG_10314 [Parastagonospora nodorum SN15]EAT82649.2 hypothetical protein SNOG_10314 [Parastagonospora nodorum SN15]